jgi:hypothetical protein
MSVIERKECPEHGAAYGWDNDGALVKCIHCGADLSRTKYVPAEQFQGAVSLAEVCEFLRAATYPDPACGGTRHVSGWQSAAVALEREFGGRT